MNYPARMALDWALISCAMLLANMLGPWAWWPAAIVVGSRQMALGEIGHMATHRLCKTANDDLFAWAAFLPLGIDPAKYRAFHMAHHRHVGDPDKDPEVAVQRRFFAGWCEHRARDPWLDAIGLHSHEAIYTITRIMSAQSAAFVVLWVALWSYSIGPVALVWPFASVTGLMVAHRLRARTEHRHFELPGVTLEQDRPAWWRRAWYLPHGTWQHWEHHHRAVLIRRRAASPANVV